MAHALMAGGILDLGVNLVRLLQPPRCRQGNTIFYHVLMIVGFDQNPGHKPRHHERVYSPSYWKDVRHGVETIQIMHHG